MPRHLEPMPRHLEPMPRHLEPMLARAGELPRADSGWAYELKWDGVRAIAYRTPAAFSLESRNLHEITARYPELAELAGALGSHSAVLDGEIVAFDEHGRPSFARLQRRMQVSSAAQARTRMAQVPAVYVIFDLLWLDGHSLTGLPYRERRERLAGLALAGASFQAPEHLTGSGEQLLKAATEQGLEGLLAKRLDSTYEPGRRSSAWVKIKLPGRQEFVIGGWLPGQGRRRERIGALLLGVHEGPPEAAGRGRPLRYVGRAGSGLSERDLAELQGLLAPLRRTRSPFAGARGLPRGAVFCEPRLVAEVSFTEWTDDGRLRHPVYLGLREDKDAGAVVREASARTERGAGASARGERGAGAGARGGGAFAFVDGRELKLSNLDKVLYPEARFTKRDLIDYYAAIAPALLPHARGRALTVTRWPDGVDGKSFFQKQAPAHRPTWVATVAVPTASKAIDYVVAEDEATLVWLANLAAVELHTPLGLAAQPARARAVVFDLDPGPGAGVLECAHVALALHGAFAQLGLSSYPKSSGSKGLQVYLPLGGEGVPYEHTKAFARAVAETLEAADPELVVSRMGKARRAGRVLMDWSQNDPRKTTVCVYSLRATPRPTASAPLRWEELSSALETADPALLAFEAPRVLARVRESGDLFAPVLYEAQALPSV